MANFVNIKNKKARHDYELLDKFVAGIQLYGTEIKSIRSGKASINEAYCVLLPMPGKPNKKEVFIKMHISEYSHGTYANHDPKRIRKLLLSRKEINKIDKKIKSTSLTLIPTRLFINDKGLAKLEFHIARGKKYHDKRETLKQNDDKREMDRLKKMRL
ncbi:MAG: SsrA-binding protein SmpB [Chlorobi bacterium]|nr:SsrA-binding protein SmpB [Chlorobiota bacterium]